MATAYAAERGHLEVVQWLIDHDYQYDQDLIHCTIRGGQLSILKWIQDNGIDYEHHLACGVAAGAGKLDILKWLCRSKFPDSAVCHSAASNGHFKVLKYLHKNNVPLGEWTFDAAIAHGDLEIIKWLFSKRYEVSPTGEIFHNETCECAAEGEHIDVLQWLIENNCPFDRNKCIISAASGGQLNMLKWLCNNYNNNNNHLTIPMLCICAASGGHAHILQWLQDCNYPNGDKSKEWKENIYTQAGANNHLNVLKWAYKNNIPYNSSFCERAATHGYFKVLKWAYDNGIPFTEKVFENAIQNNELYILKWLYEHGCPYNVGNHLVRVHYISREIITWLRTLP